MIAFDPIAVDVHVVGLAQVRLQFRDIFIKVFVQEGIGAAQGRIGHFDMLALLCHHILFSKAILANAFVYILPDARQSVESLIHNVQARAAR